MFSFLTALAEEATEQVSEAAEAVEETIEAAKADPTWVQNLVKKFGETPATVWIAVAVVAALAIILLAVSRSSKKWTAKMIAFGALSIALSFVLSCFRLYKMPTGGSVTPGSMLPLMLFSVAFGVAPGMAAGLVYGVLQYLQGGYWLNIWQFLLDYLLAFTAIGLAGIAHSKKDKWLYVAIPVAALGRAVCAILAGLMWAADYLSKGWALEIGSTAYSSSLLYSIVYNGVYLVPETIICLILAFLIAKPVLKILKTK
ncbi:MAG: energy-coupled thiamine transporter ThiT [Clostridia bacterium]|nr:energy-coupled thiamine transporter ThiT [Clostridia bacterium]